jgi:calcium-dependent protein kinase
MGCTQSTAAVTEAHHVAPSRNKSGPANTKAKNLDAATRARLLSEDASATAGSTGDSCSSGGRGGPNRPKPIKERLTSSASAIGLDEMVLDRKTACDFRQNIVHIECSSGKPIEEVYEGVHDGPVLGSGISGLVRLVTHKATGIKYACKILDMQLVDCEQAVQQLREEIVILSQLDHPNIVRLEEVYESDSEIYLVQELCVGGELFDRLDEQPDYHYSEAQCARLVKQMLSAICYIHSRGIIHRDLKLENFLFSSTDPDSELKMIDFGLSKHFLSGEVMSDPVGTPYTCAPEVIGGAYTERCDLWAIGVITYLLLSGDPPFGGCGGPESLLDVRANILAARYSFEPKEVWGHVSEAAKDFIKSLLVLDPKDRPTARQAQQHQWLQDLSENDHTLNPSVVQALASFKDYSDMRKLLCEVLSFTLLPEQIKELRKEFEKMDTDGSGEISLAALKEVLISNAGSGILSNFSEPDVEEIFDSMRVSKNETRIHWHEFIAAGLSQCQVDDRNLRIAFDRLDNDHKGVRFLTALRCMLHRLHILTSSFVFKPNSTLLMMT